jgi:hypothetical protein
METLSELTELSDLNRILLHLARSREFPDGSSRHGYDFIAPLDVQGHIDPVLWKKYRDYCRVRRFWDGEDDEVGRLVHKPGGADRARWVFDYSDSEDDDDAGFIGWRFPTENSNAGSPSRRAASSLAGRNLPTAA